VQEHKILRQLERYLNLLLLQVRVHAEQDIMGVAVVARDLLLPGDQHRRLGRLHVLLQAQIELEQVLGVLGHLVVVAHQVLNQHVRQRLVVRLADALHRQLDRLRLDLRVRLLLDQVLERLRIGRGQHVVLAGEVEVLLALEVQRHALVLLRVGLLAQRVGVELHLAVEARQVEGLVGALGHDEELDGGRVVAELLEEVGHHFGALD